MLQQRVAREREREGGRGDERGGGRAGEGAGGGGGWKPRGRGGEGWARERARKKKRAAGGRTSKLVPLDTSHSLSGWLKEVASEKRYDGERREVGGGG